MSRSLSVFSCVLLCGVTAALPAVAQNAKPTATFIAPKTYAGIRTDTVPLPDKQNGTYRVVAGYARNASEREGWTAWTEAPQPLRVYAEMRQKGIAAAVDAIPYAGFRIYDLDGDGKKDLIIRMGSTLACTDYPAGCDHVVLYADLAKKKVIFRARKFLPFRGGVMMNNTFYALFPKGGETYAALSRLMRDRAAVFDKYKYMLRPYVEKEFAPPVEFQYIRYDLKNDGTFDYIVFLDSPYNGGAFCDTADKAVCPVLIYSPTPDGTALKLVGRFDGWSRLVLASNGGPGYPEIITIANGNLMKQTVSYVYSSGKESYAPQ